jgi:hypothetical protein
MALETSRIGLDSHESPRECELRQVIPGRGCDSCGIEVSAYRSIESSFAQQPSLDLIARDEFARFGGLEAHVDLLLLEDGPCVNHTGISRTLKYLSQGGQDAAGDGLGDAVLVGAVAEAGAILGVGEVADLDQDGRTAGVDEDFVVGFADAVALGAGGGHRLVDLAGDTVGLGRARPRDVDGEALAAPVRVGVAMDADKKVRVAAVGDIGALLQLGIPVIRGS